MEAALVEEGDQLMAEALGAVLAGQEEVHNKLPKVGKRRSGSQRKHQTSPAYVRLAQEMRMALRMARSIREGHKVGWLIARRLKVKGVGIQLPCLAKDTRYKVSLLIRPRHTSTTLCGQSVAEVWRGCGPTLGTLW